MIRKNWAHNHNIRETVELVADCGAREISSHLLTSTIPFTIVYLKVH